MVQEELAFGLIVLALSRRDFISGQYSRSSRAGRNQVIATINETSIDSFQGSDVYLLAL
jgi:hypothetical protein